MQNQEFNPNDHLIKIKSWSGGKQTENDYLPVQWRLVWFRSVCPHGTIETKMLILDLDKEVEIEKSVWNSTTRRSEKVLVQAKGVAIFHAVVKDGEGGIGSGTKSENAASFPDFIEKAETGAIGRALAALGFGTQFAPDLDESHRIVDSPVDRQTQEPANSNGHSTGNASARSNAAPQQTEPTEPTQQQLTAIANISQKLGKQATKPVSFEEAKRTIQILTVEFRKQQESRNGAQQ